MKEIFSLKEVEKLVKNAYEVGLCDGIEGKEYVDADDFWNKNVKNWTTKDITYFSGAEIL